jgi:hypothetical protein
VIKEFASYAIKVSPREQRICVVRAESSEFAGKRRKGCLA